MALTRDQKVAALEKAGLNFSQIINLNDNVDANLALKGLLDDISDNKLLSSEAESALLTGLGTAWKQDPTVLTKMNADLQDPEKASQIKAAVLKNPAGFASVLPQYKGGNVPEFLASIPAAPAPAPAGSVTATQSSPDQAPQKMPTDPDKGLKFLAEASDDEIKKIMSPEIVLAIADGLSKTAKDRFGINTPAANGFARQINDDKKLLGLITENFKRNPGFIREMAKVALDKSPLREPYLSPAKTEMNKIIANPWKLANDSYVKGLEQKMKMASAVKEGDYKQLFSGFGEKFALFGDQIKSIMSGFQGLPVLSMGQGNSWIPNVMFNLGNFYENQDRAFAFSRYTSRDMTAYGQPGKDGLYTHQVAVMDKTTGKPMVGADGKPVTKEVPNTLVSITCADGKKMDVVPSIGQLRAMQDRGSYGPNGAWIPGNFQVAVVTGINKEGISTKIEDVTMTPAEFEKYKKAAEKAAGNGRAYPVEAYTEDDERARKAAQAQTSSTIIRVDPATGAIAQPSGAGVHPQLAAANGRDFTKQA